MKHGRNNSRFAQMFRLALLPAVLYPMLLCSSYTAGAQKRERRSHPIESLSYQETLALLDSLRPVDFDELTGKEVFPRQYRNWHFDRCGLWFKDRVLIPPRPKEWLFTKVSLLDLNENSTQLEWQGDGGVGLRLVTDGFQEKIVRYSETRRNPITIASYYINFGSKKKAEKVQIALRHAIQLCKAQQSEENKIRTGS